MIQLASATPATLNEMSNPGCEARMPGSGILAICMTVSGAVVKTMPNPVAKRPSRAPRMKFWPAANTHTQGAWEGEGGGLEERKT
eukprot:357859-Chlamydomonas_euryale.AAC.10